MSNTIITGSSQANAGQQAVQIALQQQIAKNGALTPAAPLVVGPTVGPVVGPVVVPAPKKTWKKDKMQMLYMFYLALVLIGALNWVLLPLILIIIQLKSFQIY